MGNTLPPVPTPRPSSNASPTTPTTPIATPIAITGLGVVSPLGLGADAFWQGLIEGRCGLSANPAADAVPHARYLGLGPALDMREHLPKAYRKFARLMARDIELAVVAANEAAARAGLPDPGDEPPVRPYAPHHLSAHVGAALIAPDIPELARAMYTAADERGQWDMGLWGEHGMGQLTPLWMLKYLPNMLACHISILHQAKGPSNTITAGEASGLLSIGEAMRVLERGDAHAALAGSGDSRVNHLAIERLRLVGRLASPPMGTDPAGIVRPFDPRAAGSVAAEAAAILTLEHPAAALARGVEPIAHLLGFACTQAIPTLDRPGDPLAHLPGLGAAAGGDAGAIAPALARAIAGALRDAGVSAGDIDAAFVHAPGEVALDAAVAHALHTALGPVRCAGPGGVELAWLTPNLGESMAATGPVLAAAAALSLRHQRLPARLHAGTPGADLNAAARPSRPAPLRHVLVATSSLGGQCAALVLGR